MKFLDITDSLETKDGSYTLTHPILGEGYHSTEGAVMEAEYVYIDSAFRHCQKSQKRVFEMGFGTGLNALLTLIDSVVNNYTTVYHTIELYPLNQETIKGLNYISKIITLESYKSQSLCAEKLERWFYAIHTAPWDEEIEITPNFRIKKLYGDFDSSSINERYSIIYWDAFSFNTQPEMWSQKTFKRVYDMCEEQAILSTYASKGDIKRALREVGFEVKRKAGFGNKRHMLTAIKL